MAKNDFTMFHIFKGETENPYNENHQTVNRARYWWSFENGFEDWWREKDSPAWNVFFDNHDLGDKFMEILTEEDYERPGLDKKKAIFDLWLEYLFKFRLYPEWGGTESTYKADYFNNAGKKIMAASC